VAGPLYCAEKILLVEKILRAKKITTWSSAVRRKSARHAGKKVGTSRSGADFFLRWNKPRLCTMKIVISRE